MANTYDADLLRQILQEEAMTSLGPVLALVDAFTTKIELNPSSPLSVVEVPIVTAGASVQTNPSNYESGDSTIGEVRITPAEKSVSFHATQAELNKGYAIRNLFRKNLQVISNAVQDVIMAPITTANFGAAVLDKTAATFTSADLQTIWAAGKDLPVKNLILEGAHYAKLLPTNLESFAPGGRGAFGFDSILLNNRFTGAGANIIGFLADPNAIAIGIGGAALSPGVAADMTSVEQVILPNGIPVQFCTWVSRATRAEWASLGLVIGAGLGDASAGKIIEGDGV